MYNDIPLIDKSILKNTLELVELIKTTPPHMIQKSFLVVIDIESLYPNINLDIFIDLFKDRDDFEYLKLLITTIKHN
jgi:hypothetical protein